MIWSDEIAPIIPFKEKAEKSGKSLESHPLLDKYNNPPDILKSDAGFFDHYRKLETHRPPVDGRYALIPYGSIRDYARDEGFSRDFSRYFIEAMMTADAKIVSHVNKNIQSKRESAMNKSKSPKRKVKLTDRVKSMQKSKEVDNGG